MVEIKARGNAYRIRFEKGQPVRVVTMVLNKRVGWRYERKVWAIGEPMTVTSNWVLREWKRQKARAQI